MKKLVVPGACMYHLTSTSGFIYLIDLFAFTINLESCFSHRVYCVVGGVEFL